MTGSAKRVGCGWGFHDSSGCSRSWVGSSRIRSASSEVGPGSFRTRSGSIAGLGSKLPDLGSSSRSSSYVVVGVWACRSYHGHSCSCYPAAAAAAAGGPAAAWLGGCQGAAVAVSPGGLTRPTPIPFHLSFDTSASCFLFAFALHWFYFCVLPQTFLLHFGLSCF